MPVVTAEMKQESNEAAACPLALFTGVDSQRSTVAPQQDWFLDDVVARVWFCHELELSYTC